MTITTTLPLVCLISDGSLTNENFPDESERFFALVRVAVRFKLPLIQIRERKLSANNLYLLAKSVMRLTSGSHTRVLINDRSDIAIAVGAEGVHLPAKAVSVESVRQFVPDNFLIGVSVHSIVEISALRDRGADFAMLAPVFSTPGKGRPLGLEGFRTIVKAHPELPILGLGGIDASNYRSILDAGGAGFAAIRFLNNSGNIEMVCRDLDL